MIGRLSGTRWARVAAIVALVACIAFGAVPDPMVARYGGSGSLDDAANFVAALPAVRHDDRIEWAGEYRSGYQQWCTWQGTNLVCTGRRPVMTGSLSEGRS
ncbi:MAG: hypothetical protein ACRDJN_30165, partial [Chloroflexota bacterium]